MSTRTCLGRSRGGAPTAAASIQPCKLLNMPAARKSAPPSQPPKAARPAEPPPSSGKRVGSAVNTMKLIRYVVGRANGGATVTEIAKATGINPSTSFNIARTLSSEGYLQWLPETKRYAVGPALADLARELNAPVRDLASLRPLMQRIATDWQLTATLWHRCSQRSMQLLMVADSESAMSIQMPVGQRLPVLLGGMGRIMALQGGLTDEQRTELFSRIQWGRPITLRSFMNQARLAQKRGFGLDEGYTHRSVTAVAVPVAPQGATTVDYVCSATMFLNQHDEAGMDALVSALQALARSAARLLGPAG